MKPLKLRTKLTLVYATVFAVLAGVIGAFVYRTAAQRFEGVIDERVTHLSSGLRGYIDFTDHKPILTYNPKEREILHFVMDATRYYQLYDGVTGELLLQSKDAELLHLALSRAEAIGRLHEPGFENVQAPGGMDLRFRNSVFRNGQQPYLLRVGLETDEEVAELRELGTVLLLSVPAGTLLAGLAGWLMARKSLRPLQQLRLAAHEIGISQLNRRLPLRGTRDELDGLAETFNDMFRRLEEAVARMKQFTANISHELRTPLAVLQGEAEIALMRPRLCEECRHLLSSQLEEFQKLRKLTNQLLTLAQADAGQIRLEKSPVDISALVLSLRHQAELLAIHKEIDLRANCPVPVAVSGDEGWLERLVLNLLDNAIKFTPEGGSVEIATGAVGDQAAFIEVSDSGIGISQESLPHIFDRFYRADSSRCGDVEGTGLGLSLVKWIVEAHSGTIQVASAPGAGTRFRILLPLSGKASLAAHA